MRFDIDKLTERLNFISEYNYYNPKPTELNEDSEDENTDSENDENQPQAGDDIEDDAENTEDSNANPNNDGGGSNDDLNSELSDELDDTSFNDANGEGMDNTDMGGGDEVEIDVTELTDGIEQNSSAIDNINQKMDTLSNTLSQHIDKMIQNNLKLATQVNKMEQNMNQQFIKRNPTPNEKLMLRSMSSYPYNQKLTDFFVPADNHEYDYSIENPNQPSSFDVKVTKTNDEDNDKEYVLTDKDVEEDYSESAIKDSLRDKNRKF